jgi:hypothetical protein
MGFGEATRSRRGSVWLTARRLGSYLLRPAQRHSRWWGAVSYRQMVPFDVHAQRDIAVATCTNALELTTSSF